MLRLVHMLVTLVIMSDGTHLSNFSGDKKLCPDYIPIANLSSEICQMPSMHTVTMVALLPIPIINCNVHKKRLHEHRQTNQEVLNTVPLQGFQHVTFKHNLNPERGYYNVLLADRNFRRCRRVLAAGLAEYPEYRDLHHLECHVCCWCECPNNDLGDIVPSDQQHPRQDHNLYRMLSHANTKAADAGLLALDVPRGSNVIRLIPCIVSDLPKPNLLHTMQIGMLDRLQKSVLHLKKTHEQLDKYNAIWLSVPAYLNLTPQNQSYVEASQWNEKEMKEMSRYLLVVVTQSLQGGSPAQRLIFNRAIECIWALLEFYMYARYKSHNDETLSYMDDALHHFHTFKEVFLLGRAGKKVKAKANALRTELVKKRKVDVEINAETWMSCKKRRKLNGWWAYISREIDVSKEFDAYFNFLKINLISQCVEQICR